MPTVDTPAETHVPDRSEVEEALAHHRATAKAALEAGNVEGWARIHGRIDELLDEWRWVAEFVG